MAGERRLEVDVMQLVSNELQADGYTVIVEPSASLLPDVLRGYRVDAVAIGKQPKLLIEIVREKSGVSDRLKQMRQLLEGITDWQLRVVVVGDQDRDPISKVSIQDIRAALNSIEVIAKSDTRAALLMCWASFEAFARTLNPSNFARPQTPGRIVEEFASGALIPPSDAAFLREMVTKRNQLIHGALNTQVEQGEVLRFAKLTGFLLTLAEDAAR